MLKYFIEKSLGKVQKVTPEGYLLCIGVPIARTGEYEYGVHELPEYEGREDGIIICERPAEVVFSDRTVASFEGKPFTVGHPEEGVDVESWGDLAAGVVQNVRRGEGEDSELLIADILVTKPEAIDEIRSGVREVSCGYDADHDQVEPGRIRLTSITGNHVALVPEGRAGHQVAIGDGKGVESGMKEKKKISFMDWLKDQFKKAKDEGVVIEVGADPAAEEPPRADQATDPTMVDICTKLDQLIEIMMKREDPEDPNTATASGNGDMELTPEELTEAELEKKVLEILVEETSGNPSDETAPGEEEKKTSTGDAKSASLVDAKTAVEFRSLAEILVPGNTVSVAAKDAKTSLYNAMRKVIDEACKKDDKVYRDAVQIVGSAVRDWAGIDDTTVKVSFRALALAKGKRHNDGAKVSPRDFTTVGGGKLTSADIATRNREYWKSKKEGK